ncbi:MAG: response regulator transcription factor [Pseudomonadales bacterium]|nr:response regulator transcription factor [Pseudomonadales bacterium]
MTTSNKSDVVLVVDDSAESLSMINDILDDAGMTVLVALEGQQALNIANSLHPDIILMDALMPNMDGFETCKQLRATSELSHIPVIFMTGLSDTESIVKGLEAGGVDYIQKPVKGDELLARMRVHLNNARQAQSARAALDTTGQLLLAVENNGHLIWATPQSHELFAQKGIDESWFNTQLQQQLKSLLSGDIKIDQGIAIETPLTPVEVRFISQTAENEYLLRVIDLDRPSEVELLKSAFSMTDRESDVLLWLSRGKSNSEIGLILEVSPRTVNKHLEQIFRKLHVENRTSAAVMALKVLEY